MNRRKHKWLVALMLAGVAVFFMGQIDYGRMENGRTPLFARWPLSHVGNRTLEYYFFGYTVVALDRLDGTQHTVGTKLDYWIPFFGRASTVTITEQGKESHGA